ncbi:hypothetical protein [Alteromonas sp. ASW11-130]|uniref:hypothetical protein n=1 Tax=Alteromonas sp. ASW11-130 TaxID=3015775 RepID=UPI0022429F57|nr:hypothetical protein [Alteromonas sp. ASW11-130]MCW8092182.1 hypothetical protein [Alteromonas sp. ASW11-130]
MLKNVINKLFTALFISGLTIHANAASILNGDFETCDFTGWNLASTDNPIPTGDFTMSNTPNGCAATVKIDASLAIANILYQEVDFSVAADSALRLTLDFSVDTTQPRLDIGTADYFDIYFNDGAGNLYDHTGELGGMYNSMDITGADSFRHSFRLDEMFNNHTGWFLEFQINSNFDELASSITINEVQLFDVSNVDTPPTLPLLLSGLLLLGVINKSNWEKRNEI